MEGAPLQFRNAGEWRGWLEAHRDTAAEAVALISKKATRGGIHYEDALDEALCFGLIDGQLHAHDAARFKLRLTPRRADSIWSASNRERVTRPLREQRMTAAGKARIREAKRSGAWQSAYQVAQVPPLPRDLRDALQTEPEAWRHFRTWGATYRSACIRWVTQAKRETTRKQRILRVVRRAAENRRPGIEGW